MSQKRQEKAGKITYLITALDFIALFLCVLVCVQFLAELGGFGLKIAPVDWPFIALYLAWALSARLLVRHLSRGNDLAKRLFDLSEKKRRRAYKQLLEKGDEAVKIFTRILSEAPRSVDCGVNFLGAIQLAAEGLGVLKARESVDVLMEVAKCPLRDIKPTAIWALAQIGDERAIKVIVPSLGDKSLIEQQRWLSRWAQEVLKASGQTIPTSYNTVRAIASAALVQLGQSDLVAAFWKALGNRDEDAVKKLRAMEEFRKEIVDALVSVLNTGTVSEAINAAHLLGDLWAFEALPELKAKASLLSTPEKVREACLEVAAELEQLSKLTVQEQAG